MLSFLEIKLAKIHNEDTRSLALFSMNYLIKFYGCFLPFHDTMEACPRARGDANKLQNPTTLRISVICIILSNYSKCTI